MQPVSELLEASELVPLGSSRSWLDKPIPLWALVVIAFTFHCGPLSRHTPANSFDANFHMSMAAHYAHHWFDPWNEQSFAGFSQTTYPPLTHQWIALLSHLFGLENAYMLVQGFVLLLLPVGMYRFSRIWVGERPATYAAFLSIFTGSLCLLVYLDGQIGTTSSITLFLLALPYLYVYLIDGHRGDLIKGIAILCTAAAAHHATLLFGSPFFALPVLWVAATDLRDLHLVHWKRTFCMRALLFASLSIIGVAITLLPYFLTLFRHPITEVTIPHTSRLNYLLHPSWGVHYFLLPFGPLALAIPFVLIRGSGSRLRPLLLGFYAAFIFGLGGTTPIPRLLLGRAFQVLTMERFAFWAVLLSLPIVGVLATELIARYRRRAVLGLALAAIGWGSFAMAWNIYFPLLAKQPDVGPIITFLGEKDHSQYRYLTLGYPNGISKIASYTEASSVDGEYNSGRTLPELTQHAVAQLTTARFYGAEGIAALRDMLAHAPRYGLRYVFVHDSFYNPLLTFAGWKPVESFHDGETVVWTTIGIPRATPIQSALRPSHWQGVVWGTVPIGTSIVTLMLLLFLRQRGCPLHTSSIRYSGDV